MDKKELFWCLDKCKGEVKISVFQVTDHGHRKVTFKGNMSRGRYTTLICIEAGEIPHKNSSGVDLDEPLKSTFIVEEIKSGLIVDESSRIAVAKRHQKVFKKYKQWFIEWKAKNDRERKVKEKEKK